MRNGAIGLRRFHGPSPARAARRTLGQLGFKIGQNLETKEILSIRNIFGAQMTAGALDFNSQSWKMGYLHQVILGQPFSQNTGTWFSFFPIVQTLNETESDKKGPLTVYMQEKCKRNILEQIFDFYGLILSEKGKSLGFIRAAQEAFQQITARIFDDAMKPSLG